MTRVLALAGQSKIGLSRSGGSPKSGPKPVRNGVPLWTETACRFPPKPPAGLNRNRLSETPKFAPGSSASPRFDNQLAITGSGWDHRLGLLRDIAAVDHQLGAG